MAAIQRTSRQHIEVLGTEPPKLRTSRQHIEVLGEEPPKLRTSRQHIEVLGEEPPKLRASRQHIEVLGAKISLVRLSRISIEVLGAEPPKLRASRQHIEVLGTEPAKLRTSRQHIEVLGKLPRMLFTSSSSIFILSQVSIGQLADRRPTLSHDYYGTVIGANQYFSLRLHERVWSRSKVKDRPKALESATRIIDALNFKGNKNDTTQSLEFPRDTDTIVPEDIDIATYEIAYSLLDGKDPDLELENLSVMTQGIQSNSTSFNRDQTPIEHIINGVPSEQAWRLLRTYLRDDDQLILSRIS